MLRHPTAAVRSFKVARVHPASSSSRPRSTRLATILLTAPTSRPFFSIFKRSPKASSSTPFSSPQQTARVLEPDDLFHPFSKSPFPALREKADRVKAASLCPVSYERYGERVHPAFDCPDCGWPTHASEQRWHEGRAEHGQYCGRLREVNEDEHDIRSGRPMKEFENMPGKLSEPLCDKAKSQIGSHTRLLSTSRRGIRSSSLATSLR